MTPIKTWITQYRPIVEKCGPFTYNIPAMSIEGDKDARIKYLEGEVERQRQQVVKLNNQNATLSLKLSHAEIDLRRAVERIALVTKWYEEQKKDADQARVDRYQVLYGQWGYNEAVRRMDPAERERFQEQIIVSNFLAGVGLTPERLGKMHPGRQEETVSRLRRLAVQAFAGPDSWNPNHQAFTAIMKFVNIYDPRVGRNQLPSGNR